MIHFVLPSGLRPIPHGSLRGGLPSGFAFALPLWQVADTGLIDAVVLSPPCAPWPARHLRLSDRPTVVVIGDDPGGTLRGSGGAPAFRCARCIAHWTRWTMIHAAGGEALHYRIAVEAAQRFGRMVVIETTSANAAGWRAVLAPRTPLLMVLPRSGVHPIGETVH